MSSYDTTRQVPAWVEKLMPNITGALFACMAMILYALLANIFYHHHAARGWDAVPAHILSADIQESNPVSLSASVISSRLVAEYRYSYAGREYPGTRVDFGFGSDSFGDERRSRQMQLLRSQSSNAYVNPRRPEESVLDRTLPVEQVNFAVIFLLFPCGLGTAMLLNCIFALCSRIGFRNADRYFGPAFGILHSLPALYAPLYAPRELGPLGWCIVATATVVMLLSIRSVWRRIGNPDFGNPLASRNYIRFK